MRQATIYSTVGQNKKILETSAVTWGDLQNELIAEGISFSGMKIVVGETQVTLESNASVLPESEFTIFMFPQKVKSGNYWGTNNNQDDDCGCEDDDDEDYEEEEDASPIGQVRLKIHQIGVALNELYDLVEKIPAGSDPNIGQLKDKAAELKRNLGIWD